MMELDEKLRARLGELAERERGGLSEVERQRILAKTRALSAAAQRRLAWRLGGSLALAAAAATIWLSIDGAPSEPNSPPVARRVAESPEARPAQASAPRPEDARPCAALPPPSIEERTQRVGRAHRVELDGRAVLVLSKDAEFDLDRSACETSLTLRRGSASVHAQDLAGGELRVQTPSGDVVVHGTIFAVTLTEESLAVSVAEGVVGIETGGVERARIETGERGELDARLEVSVRPLSRQEERRLLATISDRPLVASPREERPAVRGEVLEGNVRVRAPSRRFPVPGDPPVAP